MGTGRAETMSLSEPVGPHSASKEPSELKVSPAVAGCAHLVIVLVDILVEFVQSYSSTKVGRAVLEEGNKEAVVGKRLRTQRRRRSETWT